ncbi:hypothetical protein JCM10212_000979 [Sporobolomyces blumeae]
MGLRISQLLYRRRPPRTLVALAVSVVSSCCTALALAQPAIPDALSLPYSASFDLVSAQSATFVLEPVEAGPVYVTLSVCAPPSSFVDSEHLPTRLNTTLYVSNSSALQAPGPGAVPDEDDGQGGTSELRYGAANVTVGGVSDGLWVTVLAPDDALLGGTGGGTWKFELDVTTGAPLVVADGGASFHFDDSDQSTALVTTSNWTTPDDPDPRPVIAPSYFSIVAPTSPFARVLGRSRCFARSQAALSADNVEASTTTRGDGGGYRTQFLLQGLQGGTNYTAWLVQNVTEVSASTNATRLWDPVFFTTKNSSSCRLLYDLDFCPSVAYSVPSPLSLSTPSLVDYFNSTISPSLEAFARTLTTFPCDSTEFGQYSVVSTCSDCRAAYRDWLCATTIPRCTDAPEGTRIVSNVTWFDPETDLATWTLPDSYSTHLVRSYPPASRTPAFAPSNLSTTFPTLFNSSYPASERNRASQSPFPYAEVPPCMDLCHLVDARCPHFLGWGCPTSGGTGYAVYGDTDKVGPNERVAGDVRDSTRDERAQDRFGNVYCNALGSDLKMAAQFAQLSSSAPSSLSSLVPFAASLASLLCCIAVLA